MTFGPDSAFSLSQQVIRDLWMYNEILAFVGIFYLGKLVVKLTWTVFQGFKTHVFSKVLRPVNLRDAFGEWAVVTGSTEGVGKAYAAGFARQGLNLVLISRNLEKLSKLSDILGSQYNIEVIVIEADFSHGPSVYSRIEEQLNELDVGILVNNVGIISPRPLYVAEMSEHSMWDHIYVNIGSVTIMSRLVIPKMLNKKKGAIINVSSISALAPVPLLSVYAATKAYVDYFSQGLQHELKDTGIVVQTLIPSYIKTQMVSYSPLLMASQYLVPSPEVFVRHSLPTLGISSRTTGYWLHGMQAQIMSWIPISQRISMIGWLNKYFRKVALNARD